MEPKDRIKMLQLRHCDLANEIGTSESTVFRWLRTSMTSSQKAKVNAGIDRLKEKRIKELMNV